MRNKVVFYFGGIDSPFWDNVSLKVDRSKMLSTETAADAILFALTAEPQAVPMEINIQPESHLFLEKLAFFRKKEL